MSNTNTGAIYGALDPDSREAINHAKIYYEAVRNMKTDCENIAKNINWDKQIILDIKNHIFINEHNLGRHELSRFDPDYHMARSWQRLIDGKDIQEMDIILLNHEYMELKLMRELNIPYSQAHRMTSKTYDYSKYVIQKEKNNE